MNYEIFDSKAEALNYSEQAGVEAGLAYHKGNPKGTRYMYSVIEHPIDGRGAVATPQGTITKEQLQADGWFTEPEQGV